MKKIGVLAGAFDPIHQGHLDFINRIVSEKSLNKIYLLVEKKPKHKPVFADYNHRMEMIELAVKNQAKIKVYDCQIENYLLSRCLPKIEKAEKPSQIYLLLGHDVAQHINSWENSSELLKGVELVVASRDDGITSGKIRNSLLGKQQPNGLDPAVLGYIKRHNLYGREIMSGA